MSIIGDAVNWLKKRKEDAARFIGGVGRAIGGAVGAVGNALKGGIGFAGNQIRGALGTPARLAAPVFRGGAPGENFVQGAQRTASNIGETFASFAPRAVDAAVRTNPIASHVATVGNMQRIVPQPIQSKVTSTVAKGLGKVGEASVRVNPVTAVPQAIAEQTNKVFAKQGVEQRVPTPYQFGQGVLQAAAQAPVRAVAEVTGKPVVPKSDVAKGFLGDRPVSSYSSYARETADILGKGTGEKIPGPAQLPLGVGLAAMDIYPGGGGKTKLAKSLAGIDDVAIVSQTLKRLGLADDVIKDAAPKISKSKDPEEVNKVLNGAGVRNVAESGGRIRPRTTTAEIAAGKPFTLTPETGTNPLQGKGGDPNLLRNVQRDLDQGKQVTVEPTFATKVDQPSELQRVFGRKEDVLGKTSDPGFRVVKSEPFEAPMITKVGKTETSMPAKTDDVAENTPGKYAPVETKNGIVEQAKSAFTDKNAPLISALQKMEKQSGETGLVDQFRFDVGKLSRANSIANAKTVNSEGIQKAFKGLSKPELDDFNRYVAARTELSTYKPGMQTSRPVEELQKIVDTGSKHAERFEGLNQFYKDRATDMRKAGLIDEVKYRDWMSNNDYARIQREMDDIAAPTQGKGNAYSLGTTSATQKRTGSAREIQPADLTAFERAQQVESEIQRNTTASNLIDTLKKFGMATKLTAKEAVRKNTIKRIVDGKTEIYEIDPVLKGVIDNISPFQLNALERIIGFPGRLFRAGTTSLNAPFSITNYLKDQVGSGINSKRLAATHSPQNIASGLKQATKDQFGGTNDELWNRFISHAGDTTQFDLNRNVRSGRTLSRQIRAGKAGSAGNAVLHPIRTLEDVISITEKATRFQNFKGTYQKLIKDGMSEQEAFKESMLQAWQNSVDFNTAGSWGRMINLLVPYFNPAIQGTRQLGRSFKQRPVATSAKVIAGVTMPLLAVTAWNTSDPKRKFIYDNISDFEKDNNFIIVMPNTEQNEDGTYNVIKIPIVLGFGNLAQPSRRAYESFINQNPMDAQAMAEDVLRAVSGPVDIHSPERALASVTPAAIKPIVQQAANKDFFTGKPIVPEYLEKGTDDEGNPLKETDKAYDHTSGTARGIANILGVSPLRVEKFVRDTFGKTGLYTENAVDKLLASAGVIPDEQVGGISVKDDIVRRFSEAQSNYNFMKSNEAKFFEEKEKIGSELKGDDKALFEAFFMKNDNKTGLDNAGKMNYLLGNKEMGDGKLYEAMLKLSDFNRSLGEPIDPLFDRNVSDVIRTQETAYEAMKLARDVGQGYTKSGKSMYDAFDMQRPEFQQFKTDRQKFFDSLPAKEQTGLEGDQTLTGEAKPAYGTGYDLYKNFLNKERAEIGLSTDSGGSGGFRKGGGRRGGGGGGKKIRMKKGKFSSRRPTVSVRKAKAIKKVSMKRSNPKFVGIKRQKIS